MKDPGADLAECLELDAACRRVFQAAAALRTDNKKSVLAVKRTARSLKLLMDDKLHSLDIDNVIDGFGDEAETRMAGARLCCLRMHKLSAVLCIDRVCRDCNIHDRMSFASFFGAALIVIAIVLLAQRLLHCIRSVIDMRAFVYEALLESRDDIW